MFDNLSNDAQYELLGYAKRCIFGAGRDISLRDRFWAVLEKGGSRDGSWNDIEEFADELICRENIYKGRPEHVRKETQ